VRQTRRFTVFALVEEQAVQVLEVFAAVAAVQERVRQVLLENVRPRCREAFHLLELQDETGPPDELHRPEAGGPALAAHRPAERLHCPHRLREAAEVSRVRLLPDDSGSRKKGAEPRRRVDSPPSAQRAGTPQGAAFSDPASFPLTRRHSPSASSAAPIAVA
jgi:hypothetical protein